jgi:hypothetical protein
LIRFRAMCLADDAIGTDGLGEKRWRFVYLAQAGRARAVRTKTCR